MARNQSEKAPHPEVSWRFHERARLWEIYNLNRSTRNKDTYDAYCDTFSAMEESGYGALSPSVHLDLKAHYKVMAKVADRAA